MPPLTITGPAKCRGFFRGWRATCAISRWRGGEVFHLRDINGNRIGEAKVTR